MNKRCICSSSQWNMHVSFIFCLLLYIGEYVISSGVVCEALFDDVQPATASARQIVSSHTCILKNQEWPKSDHGIDAWRNRDIYQYQRRNGPSTEHCTSINLLDSASSMHVLWLLWSDLISMWMLSSYVASTCASFFLRVRQSIMCNCWVSNFLKNDSGR